ncbi:MAG: corrinoid protein [Pelosinus sp.]|nr:corrinoid protein [Pelosinus sp.]
MCQQIILQKLKNAVAEMDTNAAEEAAREAVNQGVDPVLAISNGLAQGMKTVSDLFDEGEAFIPHLLVAAEAFECASAILYQAMTKEARQRALQGKVLIYTVQGDIHDIGKNVVKTMLSAGGFQIFDLGRDVPAEEVVKAAREHKVDIIASVALMTTSMPIQKEIIKLLLEEGVRDQYKILLGGAPVSAEWTAKIGADGFAESASQAVEVAKMLMLRENGRLVGHSLDNV